MADDLTALIERLNTMYSHRGDGIPTQLVNPDGPEAAQAITELRERVASYESGAAIEYIIDRAKEAEAQRDEAVKALQRIGSASVAFNAHPVGVIETMRQWANDALAKIGGAS